MPARPQATCYPSQGLVTQNGANAPVCTICNSNSPHVQPNCSGSSNSTACGACVACNTVCVDQQAYCLISRENINTHGDVGTYTNICMAQNEIIIKQWTAAWWNDLQDDLLTANTVGKTQSQGASLTMTPAVASPPPQNAAHPANSLITAEKYNQIIRGLNAFNQTINEATQNDPIKAARALAFQTGFNAARFNSGVCDVCNASAQSHFNCSCNCTCSCECSCPCAYGP